MLECEPAGDEQPEPAQALASLPQPASWPAEAQGQDEDAAGVHNRRGRQQHNHSLFCGAGPHSNRTPTAPATHAAAVAAAAVPCGVSVAQ